MNTTGAVLILLGVVRLAKPDSHCIWLEVSFLRRKLSPKNYLTYMRFQGVVLIVLGVMCFLH